MDALSTSLMLKMRHNRVYTAVTFARLFGVSEKMIEHALAALIESGAVRTCANARRNIGYCLSGATPVTGIKPLPESTSIATQPVLRRIDGVLAGYDGQLDALRSLAMLARR
jgi:predicted DNA-binding transcriptional regulator